MIGAMVSFPRRGRPPVYLVISFLLCAFPLVCEASAPINAAVSEKLAGTLRETNFCSLPSCKECKTVCPSSSEMSKEIARCRAIQPLLRNASLDDAFVNCTKDRCELFQLKRACGLFQVDTRHMVTPQVYGELKIASEQLSTLRIQRRKFDEANQLSPTVSLYYERALHKIEESNEIFRNALSARARNVKIKEYLNSLEYRRVTQEVTRFKFENDDLRRHLKFWETQYKTLTHAVRTSPEGLKDARDALRNEMLSYEADAALISALQNTSLSKEARAELVIKLRETVKAEIDLARTQHAHLLREEQFIKGARKEIFLMLRDVLLKLRTGRLPVRCGGDMLSDIVSDAIAPKGS